MIEYVIARRIFKALLVCLTLFTIPLVIALVIILTSIIIAIGERRNGGIALKNIYAMCPIRILT